METDVRPLVVGRLVVTDELLLYEPDDPVAVAYELRPAEAVATLVREVVAPLFDPVLYAVMARVADVREVLTPLVVPVRPDVRDVEVLVRPVTTAERVVAPLSPRKVLFVVPSETAV